MSAVASGLQGMMTEDSKGTELRLWGQAEPLRGHTAEMRTGPREVLVLVSKTETFSAQGGALI